LLFSITEDRTLGFGRRQYGRLFLAIAGILAHAAGHITAKLHSSTSIGGWVIDVCATIYDGGRRHLGFNFCSIFWHTCM